MEFVQELKVIRIWLSGSFHMNGILFKSQNQQNKKGPFLLKKTQLIGKVKCDFYILIFRYNLFGHV